MVVLLGMDKIRLEILNYNYWEHFKKAKDLAKVLPPNHPQRIIIEKDMNDILKQIRQINPLTL